LREDQAAQLTYRQLARDLNDPSANLVFGLLVREIQEDCELLQRIIDGTLDDPATTTHGIGGGVSDSGSLQSVCPDIQALARGSRRHAEQLRDLACAERGRAHVLRGAILDTLARDSDKHASLLLDLACHLRMRC
jgi:hypothetical protein